MRSRDCACGKGTIHYISRSINRRILKRIFIGISAVLFLCNGMLFSQTSRWKKIAQLNSGVQAFFFLDTIYGWAANGASQIYRTTDGGYNWVQYGSNAGFGVKSISFSDSLNGWIVGTVGNGFIIRTTDGGKTWVTQLEKPQRTFLSTHSFNTKKNITSGMATNYSSLPDTGNVVETTDGGNTLTETTPFDSISSYKKFNSWIRSTGLCGAHHNCEHETAEKHGRHCLKIAGYTKSHLQIPYMDGEGMVIQCIILLTEE